MLDLIARCWELLGRFARFIVKIDDALVEGRALWNWLFGDDDEPEE